MYIHFTKVIFLLLSANLFSIEHSSAGTPIEILSSLFKAIKNKDISFIQAVGSKIASDLDKDSKRLLEDTIFENISDQKITTQMLFDLGISGHQQSILASHIIEYLKKEQAIATTPLEYKNRTEVIDYFTRSKGECSGLAVLWSYAKRLTDESATQQERDDLTFFATTYRTLITWDKVRNFTSQEKAAIERFIGNLILFQKPAFEIFSDGNMQLDLSVVLEDTKRGRPMEVFNHHSILSKSMLKNRLMLLLKPKTLFFIGVTKKTNGHLIALYQTKSGVLYLYDPNSPHGEIVIKNIDELTDALWQATDPSQFMPGFGGFDPVDGLLRHITIKIFKFPHDPVYSYPTSEQYTPAIKEFLDIFHKTPWLTNLAFKNYLVTQLIEELTEAQAREILASNVALDLKNILNIKAGHGAEPTRTELLNKKSIIMKNILNLHVQAMPDKDKIKFWTNEALHIKEQLPLDEVLVVLLLNIGNEHLIKEFLMHCCGAPITFNQATLNLIGLRVQVLLEETLGNNLPVLAHFIIKMLNERFGKTSSYPLINTKALIMKNITDLKFSDNPNKTQITFWTQEALHIKDQLQLSDVLSILFLNTGNQLLAQQLLQSCCAENPSFTPANNSLLGLSLHTLIKENIDNNYPEVAKFIIDTLFHRFGIMPSPKTMKKFSRSIP